MTIQQHNTTHTTSQIHNIIDTYTNHTHIHTMYTIDTYIQHTHYIHHTVHIHIQQTHTQTHEHTHTHMIHHTYIYILILYQCNTYIHITYNCINTCIHTYTIHTYTVHTHIYTHTMHLYTYTICTPLSLQPTAYTSIHSRQYTLIYPQSYIVHQVYTTTLYATVPYMYPPIIMYQITDYTYI